jgi:hypothetical protein
MNWKIITVVGLLVLLGTISGVRIVDPLETPEEPNWDPSAPAPTQAEVAFEELGSTEFEMVMTDTEGNETDFKSRMRVSHSQNRILWTAETGGQQKILYTDGGTWSRASSSSSWKFYGASGYGSQPSIFNHKSLDKNTPDSINRTQNTLEIYYNSSIPYGLFASVYALKPPGRISNMSLYISTDRRPTIDRIVLRYKRGNVSGKTVYDFKYGPVNLSRPEKLPLSAKELLNDLLNKFR